MTSKPKFVSIESFGKEDLKDLFDFISTNILKSTPLKVKQDVLKLKGSVKELNEHSPTIPSILTLIDTYDLKFELIIKYVDKEKDSFKALERDETDIQKELFAQEEEVSQEVASMPPVYEKKEVNRHPVLPTPDRKVISDDDLPEFN